DLRRFPVRCILENGNAAQEYVLTGRHSFDVAASACEMAARDQIRLRADDDGLVAANDGIGELARVVDYRWVHFRDQAPQESEAFDLGEAGQRERAAIGAARIADCDLALQPAVEELVEVAKIEGPDNVFVAINRGLDIVRMYEDVRALVRGIEIVRGAPV